MSATAREAYNGAVFEFKKEIPIESMEKFESWWTSPEHPAVARPCERFAQTNAAVIEGVDDGETL